MIMVKCLISTLWETLKVIIRGNIIPHTSAAKRERERNGYLKSTILLGKAYQISKSPDDYRVIYITL